MPKYVNTRYLYRDIFIFYKTQKGYISLADIDISSFIIEKHEYCQINDDSAMLIALWSGKDFLISPASFDDLITLSKLTDNSPFIAQCHALIGDKEQSDALLAMICAKNICSYPYGKITLKQSSRDLVYEFRRRQIVDNKRTYPVVLEKTFRRAYYE